jgi:hypothetical protein
MISLTLALLMTNLAATPTIEIAGEEACPPPLDIAARLAELVAPDSPVLRSLHVHLARKGDRLRIEIDDSHGARLVERSVPLMGSCADVARAVALVVASWAGEIGGAPDRPPVAIPATDNPTVPFARAPTVQLELRSREQPPSPAVGQVAVPWPDRAREAATPGRAQRAFGLVAGGVGVASLVVGAIYGFAAESDDRAAENACLAGSCGVAAGAQIARAESDARRSEVYLGLGAGLVATGAIVYLLAPSTAEIGPVSEIRVAPVAMVRSAGVVATARF